MSGHSCCCCLLLLVVAAGCLQRTLLQSFYPDSAARHTARAGRWRACERGVSTEPGHGNTAVYTYTAGDGRDIEILGWAVIH